MRAGYDQVLLVLLKADYTLERLQVWDTLGMRGTHSEGFTLRARAAAGQILPEPYERIHAQTMVPFAHILWGSVWAGIAAAAAAQGAGIHAPCGAPVERPDAARRRAFHPGGIDIAHVARRAGANLRSYEVDHVG